MNDLYVGDLVAHVGDRNVVGHALSTTQSTGGLHPPTSLDIWDAGTGPQFTNSGLVPVRWNTDDGVPYEWWEAPGLPGGHPSCAAP
ncbi:hypothetical protein [Mycobacterium avium]|uniref:hypothetical protein n=1 Tax=Mycobacterium avium TaxID=1764 RepID=UPI001155ECBE|nr:hypothetical protein [Mycobacterium avium]